MEQRWSRLSYCILALAFCVRLAFLLGISHPELLGGEYILQNSSDEKHYHSIAVSLAQSGHYSQKAGGPPTMTRPPGVVFPMALLYRIFGPFPLLAVAYILVCSLLIVVTIGNLARVSGGSPAAVLIAQLLAALLPTLTFVTGGIWSEPPALLFLLVALALLLRFDSRGAHPGLACLAGLSMAMAYLSHPSVAPMLALVVAKLMVDALKTRQFMTWLLVTSLWLLPIAAWGLRNQLAFDTFMVGNTSSTLALWGANNTVTAGAEKPALKTANGTDLHEEAEQGLYLGSWVPAHYLAAESPVAEMSELELYWHAKKRISSFIWEHPPTTLKLLFYKGFRILTAEPMAPSVSGDSMKKRQAKWAVTFSERWFMLVFGGVGMLFLNRTKPDHFWYYLLFVVGALATQFVGYSNARIFIGVTVTLIVPASLAVEALVRYSRRKATIGSTRVARRAGT